MEAILAIVIGGVLRELRRDRHLTLKQVEVRSGARFKSTSLAAYERGERQISLARFLDLCSLYEVAPGSVTEDIRARLAGSPGPGIPRPASPPPEAETRQIAPGPTVLLTPRSGEPPTTVPA